MQHTLDQMKQSSLYSQDKLIQVSADLWTNNNVALLLKRNQVC